MLKKEEKIAKIGMKIDKSRFKSYSGIFKEIVSRIRKRLRKSKINMDHVYLTLENIERSKMYIILQYGVYKKNLKEIESYNEFINTEVSEDGSV
jgi:hypothetical protein